MTRLDANRVARRPGDDAVGAEDLPQAGDVVLHRVDGGLRRLEAPELVDQAVDRNNLVRVGEQEGEQRPLPAASKRDRHAVVENLERAEDPELHRAAAARL